LCAGPQRERIAKLEIIAICQRLADEGGVGFGDEARDLGKSAARLAFYGDG